MSLFVVSGSLSLCILSDMIVNGISMPYNLLPECLFRMK